MRIAHCAWVNSQSETKMPGVARKNVADERRSIAVKTLCTGQAGGSISLYMSLRSAQDVVCTRSLKCAPRVADAPRQIPVEDCPSPEVSDVPRT